MKQHNAQKTTKKQHRNDKKLNKEFMKMILKKARQEAMIEEAISSAELSQREKTIFSKRIKGDGG